MEGILIGTGILWLVKALMVAPLTKLSLARRMTAAGAAAGGSDVHPDQKAEWERVSTHYYILWDVLMLSMVGFVGGLLGFWFIGISLEAKGWPGMIAFVAMSLLGLAARGV